VVDIVTGNLQRELGKATKSFREVLDDCFIRQDMLQRRRQDGVQVRRNLGLKTLEALSGR